MSVSPEISPVQLAQAELTTTHAVLYSVPGGKKAIVQRLVLANTALAPSDVSVSLVPTNSPGDLTNRIMHTVPIPAEGLVAFDMYQVVSGAVAASASPATVTLTVSGSLFDFVTVPGSWDAQGEQTWDSMLSTMTWDSMIATAGYAWDNYPAGKTWDSAPAGDTWNTGTPNA